MNTPVRILHLEDSSRDAELIRDKLEASGLACDITLVDNPRQYADALAAKSFDAILCDYNVPDYSGLAALKLARERQPATPVIIISGALDEYEAVQCLQLGAADYLLKQRLDRLPTAVNNALEKAKALIGRVKAETELQDRDRIFMLSRDLFCIAGYDGFFKQLNPAWEATLGHAPAELMARPIIEFVHPEDRAATLEARRKMFEGEETLAFENRYRCRDGGYRWLLWNTRYDPEQRLVYAVAHDITARKMNEERLRLQSSALEAAANAILITDREGVIEWVNTAFSTFTGYAAAEAVGRRPAELLKSGQHAPAFYQAMWDTINRGRVWQGELINRRKDGSLYPEEMTITPLRDDAGGITHFIAVKLDITLRKRAEEALLESEERHRMLFQNNPLPMWVYDTGTLAFLAVNQTAMLQYGYSEAEFLAMTIREIRPAEDLARLEEDLAAPAPGKEFSGPWRHRKKNGELIEVEISSDAIRFAGRPARLVLASDITARQRAAWRAAQLKAALTKSAREWRVTFDTLDIPVMLVGGDGLVRRMNRAARELTGREYAENLGHSLPQLSGVFPWSRTLALIRGAMETKKSAGAQLRDHASGRIWDCTASYYHNREGEDEGVVFSAREITRLVKLQESLRRGETLSALGSLVSGVAHEVRNPLFGIMATLDAFEANHGDKPEFREYLSILRGESERLSALMKDLLDYGRPPELNPDRGSIEALLDDALKPVRALALPAGVRLKLDCARGLPDANFDRSRLPQVFINLLDNAVRHSPPGGTVRLSAALAAETGWLEIAVLDEGPGIRPEDIPRLFQPFFTRRAGGTGLGLAIVQRIVEQHGGQVSAANRPEGGAVFAVRLPIGAEG